MAYDANVTALINRALSYLGESKISNTDAPESTAGQQMVDNYDPCRREVLRRVPWSFAECWGTLTYIGPAPAGFDYPDAYALPADFIRIIDIPGITSASLTTSGTSFSVDYSTNDYSIQDYRLIQMNGQRALAMSNNAANTLGIAYTCDTTNLTLWDPLALKCLAGWMALDVAKSITGMDSLVAQLDRMVTADLQDAIGVNGNEQRKRLHQYSRTQRDRQLAQMGNTGYFTPVAGYPAT